MFSLLSEHQSVSGSLRDRSIEAYKAVALWVERNLRSDCEKTCSSVRLSLSVGVVVAMSSATKLISPDVRLDAREG